MVLRFIKIITFFISTIFIYLIGILLLSNIKYKGNPLIYVTNNYYVKKGGDIYDKFLNFDKTQQFDFVFTGSSRAYRGYDPMIFESKGFKTYNLGSSAQPINNTWLIIKSYITSANTKNLIVDIYPGTFTSDYNESSIRLMTNVENAELRQDLFMSNKDLKLVNVFLASYLDVSQKPYYFEDDYKGKGFSSKSDEMSEDLKKLNKYSKKSKISIELDEIEFIENIVNFCKENVINLYFVVTPTTKSFDHEQHEVLKKHLEPYFRQSHVRFLDFSDLFKDVEQSVYFYDLTHMNTKGATIFNHELINVLNNDNFETN
jgi:hypothetical protein